MSNTFLTVFCLIVTAAEIAAWSPFENQNIRDILKQNRRGSDLKKIGNGMIQQMSVSDSELGELSAALLLQGKPIGSQVPTSKVGAPFHWESCGAAVQLVDIHNLTIQPSPLSFPGPLNFGFDIEFLNTISGDAKVAADVKLEINARGTWIAIPCIGGIGSCHYDDLCSLMQEHVHCPPDILSQGIPCTCPFNKGEYKLMKYSIDVDATVFPSGDYRAQATLTDSAKGQIACYKLSFTVE